MPTRTLNALYGTAAVLIALAVVLGGIKLWPRSGPIQRISAKRAFLYILIIAVTLVLLGIVAAVIAALIIAAIKARRSALAVA
jgi:hypothetical protein